MDDTGVISSSSAELLIMVLWIAITIGRVLGVVDQMFIDTPTLYHHLTAFLVGGVLSLALLLALPGTWPARKARAVMGAHSDSSPPFYLYFGNCPRV